MVNWFEIRSAPIDAVETAVAKNDDVFRTQYVGPSTWENMDYPVAEILPEETARTGPNDWEHSIRLNLYFERTKRTDYAEHILRPVSDVLTDALAELSALSCVNNYRPERIEDYAGELDDTLIILVSIELRVETLIDVSDF